MNEPRKIQLDTSVYCPHAYTRGGEKDCDHDYDPKPVSKSDHGATWACTKCGMRTTFDIWD